jgi:hypothetical protein
MFRADFLPFTSKIVEHSRYLPAALFHEVAPGMFTLLFTLHPELPWLVMGGLMLSASSTIFGIEPYVSYQAVCTHHAVSCHA